MNRAQRALDNVQSRPRDVVAWSKELLDDPAATAEERASAAWALGRAYGELGHVEPACAALERGIGLAAEADLDALTSELRISLSTSLVMAGRIAAAKHQLDLAEAGLAGDGARGRHRMQCGYVAMHAGELEQSIAHYDEALALLADGADELARARLLVNRGIASTMIGAITRGRDDFVAAQELAETLGQHVLAAGSAQNLGFAAGRQGDVPSALRWFARARSLYQEVGSPPRVMGLLESDFATVLLTSGLYAEAVEAAGRAAEIAARTGDRLDEAEARLLVARAELAGGDTDEAERSAREAASIFLSSDREAWAAIADYVGLQAAAVDAPPSAELLSRALSIVERLHSNGWWREALEAQTLAGRTAVALGRLDEARRLLGEASARSESGSSGLRVPALLATATLHLADGDRPSAQAALSKAMTLVEEHRATLGSTELRAYASINGAEVAELGLQLATEAGRPEDVFEWAERWRAGSLQVAGLRPDPDSRLAAALAELREAHSATIPEASDPIDTDGDRRIGRLEREIRALSRESGGKGDRLDPLALGELQSVLDGRTIVEYFTVDGWLQAITATESSAAIHDLGPLIDIERHLRRLTTSLDRLAHAPASGSRDAVDAAIQGTARLLEQRLLSGIEVSPDQELVVVPTSPLQTMPWAVLPSLADVAVTVTPSGWLWAGASPQIHGPSAPLGDGIRGTSPRDEKLGAGRALGASPSTPPPALLVCGPELPGGRSEVERLAELYGDAVVLAGDAATVSAVVEAMAGADVAHIAAHGSFRSDNPMLSGLLLHDGPLTVYDLEALPRPPRTVVLPACNAARSSIHRGDELLGTAAALLQSGVRSVIAPVTVVPDATVTPDLMIELHARLRSGRHPSEALVDARHAAGANTAPAGRLVAMSFIAIDSRQRPRSDREATRW